MIYVRVVPQREALVYACMHQKCIYANLHYRNLQNVLTWSVTTRQRGSAESHLTSADLRTAAQPPPPTVCYISLTAVQIHCVRLTPTVFMWCLLLHYMCLCVWVSAAQTVRAESCMLSSLMISGWTPLLLLTPSLFPMRTFLSLHSSCSSHRSLSWK